MSVSIGLAVLRIALGLLLAGHGTQKLFGWFGGGGTRSTGSWFESVGYRPGRPLAVLAGACETTGGVLLATGLLTPLAAAIVIGVMASAAAVHARNGVWNARGGLELPGFNAAAAVALAFTGPGSYSLDHLIGLSWGWPYGLAAVIAGLLASAVMITLRARNLRSAAAASTSTGTGQQSHQPVAA